MKSLQSHLLLFTSGLLAATPVLAVPPASEKVTPAEWLDAQPKPAFKAGHTLPRLTRYGSECMPLVTGKPLAKDWGYALEFTQFVTDLEAVARIDVPGSREAQTVALALAEPDVYKLNVATTQAIPFENVQPSAYTRDVAGNILSAQGISADGTKWGGVGPLISLEAPDSLWEAAGELRAAPLRALVARGIPIDSIHNGGESGLGIPGFAQDVWNKDPVIGAAIGASQWGPGSMYNHASAKKGNSELIIARITKAAVPKRGFFNYYCAGGGTHRNQDWAVDAWGPRWQHTRGTNDIPSNEAYFPTTKFTGNRNILLLALNATSLEIATGDTLSYNWISGGWDGDIADNGRWAGFLKCYYTAGMIGSNTGVYGGGHRRDFTFVAPFPQDKPPFWLTQLIATSHVHALFSQLEDYVRNGDLLPGPARHGISPDEPAYEFPTGDDTARVLVRKHRKQASWLITAWAADGDDRTVPIYVPELGQLNVDARAVGSVYTANLRNGKVAMVRHDNEGAKYTAVAPGKAVVLPVNLAHPVPMKDQLHWFAADHGVTADAAGKVSAWTSQSKVPLKIEQSNPARQPSLVKDAISGKPALRFENGKTWLENMDLGKNGDPFIGPISVYAVFTSLGKEGRGAVVMGAIPNGNSFLNGQGFVITDGTYQRLSNGVAMATSSGSLTSRMQTFTIGETNGPGQSFGYTGDIAEILVYKGQSPLNQERVRLYLEKKYNFSRNSTLVNGSFESPTVAGYLYTPGPATTVSRGDQGWYFASNSAIQANGSSLSAPTAPSGIQTAFLQGTDGRLGIMSQMVHLSAGNYKLRFKAARRSGQIQPVKVSVNQNRLGELITPKSDQFEDYTTASFTVSDGLHLIRLEATDGGGDKSVFIDDITLDGSER